MPLPFVVQESFEKNDQNYEIASILYNFFRAIESENAQLQKIIQNEHFVIDKQKVQEILTKQYHPLTIILGGINLNF